MKVPVYGEQQVAPSALPDVHAQALVNPAAGAVGQGLQQLGAGVHEATDALDHAMREADEVAVTNNLTQYRHDANAVLLGAPAPAAPGTQAQDDPDHLGGGPGGPHDAPAGPSGRAVGATVGGDLSPNGFLNEEGMSAAKYSAATERFLAQRRDEIAKGLVNDRQRVAFLTRSGEQLEEYQASVQRHVGRQTQVAKDASSKAAVAGALGDVANNYADPKAVELSISSVEPSLRGLALSKEDGDARVAAVRQQAYSTVIRQQLADRDWKGAQASMSRYGNALAFGEHGAEERAQLEHAITTARAQGEGQELAQGIHSSALRPSGQTDVAAMDQQFLALPTEKKTPEAWAAYRETRTTAEDGNRANAAQYASAAMSAYLNRNNLNDIPPEKWAWVGENDPKVKYELEEMDRRHRAELAAAGRGRKLAPTEDQWSLYFTTKDALVQDPARFKEVTPEVMRHNMLSLGLPQDLTNRLTGTLIKTRGQKGASPSTLEPFQDHALIDLMKQAGRLEDDGKPKDLDEKRRLEEAAIDFRTQYKAGHKGEEPNGEQIRAFGAPLLNTAKVKGSGFLGFGQDEPTIIRFRTQDEFRGKSLEAEDETPKPWAAQFEAMYADKNKPLPKAPAERAAAIHAVYKTALDKLSRENPAAGGAPPPSTPASGAPDPAVPGPAADTTPAAAPAKPAHSGPPKITLPEMRITGKPPAKAASKPPVSSLIHPAILGLVKDSLRAGSIAGMNEDFKL